MLHWITLHPISAIDISKVQSSAIPKEYTKQFPSIMSWNKLSKHSSLSPSDRAPCQWSVFESFCIVPGIDPRTRVATSLNYIIQHIDMCLNHSYLLFANFVLQVFLKHGKCSFGDGINPRNIPLNYKQNHQIIHLVLSF